MMTIEEKIKTLLPEAKKEANDFIDFLIEKTHKEDKQWHLLVSEKAIDKIWDNTEDDVYNELLKGCNNSSLISFSRPIDK